MHRSRLAAVVAFLAFAIYSPYVFATGDVLVPPDDDTPPAQTPNASSSDSDADNPATAAEPATPKASSAQNYTPVPAGMPSMSTKVVEYPNLAGLAAKTTLPYSLAIILPHGFQWSNQDLGQIQNTLGISPEDAVKHCRLSANGALRTNSTQGFYTYDLGLGSNSLVPYDGYINNMSVYLRALCDAGGLPLPRGPALKVGDKYAIPLMTPVNCSPPSPQIRQALVEYDPREGGSCAFH